MRTTPSGIYIHTYKPSITTNLLLLLFSYCVESLTNQCTKFNTTIETCPPRPATDNYRQKKPCHWLTTKATATETSSTNTTKLITFFSWKKGVMPTQTKDTDRWTYAFWGKYWCHRFRICHRKFNSFRFQFVIHLANTLQTYVASKRIVPRLQNKHH